jgi:subtilisin family serine protease
LNNIRLIILSVFFLCIIIIILILVNRSTDEYYYGNSFRQNKLVNTIRLHKYGITGKGVNIGIIDAGFYSDHTAFENTRIIKEFDFARNEVSTSDYNHVKGMDHGTNVFSMIGGYKVNELIGIAFGANFLLAKTDINTSRLKEEEITAVIASRWLFASGAHIITTSLSFNKFDNADYYHPSQMNGRTALITKAADSLVNEGVIYFASAGNNFENDWKIIESPADGFGVVAVGSVDKNLQHSFFSSCGPSADGRIKPDIATPGEGVWNANYLPKIKPEFSWNHGTSLSASIAAGIAALVLSAHPELRNHQVIEALKITSSKSDSPDSLYGWGIPDAEKIVTYFGPAFSNVPELEIGKDGVEINTYIFSYYGLNKTSVRLHLLGSNSEEEIYKMIEIDEDYFSCSIKTENGSDKISFYFTAKDIKGQLTRFPSGFLDDQFTYDLNENRFVGISDQQ